MKKCRWLCARRSWQPDGSGIASSVPRAGEHAFSGLQQDPKSILLDVACALSMFSCENPHTRHFLIFRYFIGELRWRIRRAKNNVSDNYIPQKGSCENIRREMGEKGNS